MQYLTTYLVLSNYLVVFLSKQLKFKNMSKFKFEKQFRSENPQTIRETDKYFDLDNYKDWLESKFKNDMIKFSEWCSDNFGKYEKSQNTWYRYLEEDEDDFTYTTEQLFEIFIGITLNK